MEMEVYGGSWFDGRVEESKSVWKAVPVAIDAELEELVDQVAKAKGQKKSVVMREAMRVGLPIVKIGGNWEVVPVDPELQSDVTKVTAWKGLSRGKLLLEALKIGLPAVNARLPNADEKQLPDNDFFPVFAANDPNSVPVARDFRRAEYKAAYLRDVMEQVCLLTEVEETMERERQEARGERTPVSQKRSVRDQIQRADRVHRWARTNGKFMGASLDMVTRFPYETFCRYEAEMLAEEAASGKNPESAPRAQTSATAVPVPASIPTPSPKPKASRKPRKE
jgi:hypothetical protein